MATMPTEEQRQANASCWSSGYVARLAWAEIHEAESGELDEFDRMVMPYADENVRLTGMQLAGVQDRDFAYEQALYVLRLAETMPQTLKDEDGHVRTQPRSIPKPSDPGGPHHVRPPMPYDEIRDALFVGVGDVPNLPNLEEEVW
jgi:hypothetical protein